MWRQGGGWGVLGFFGVVNSGGLTYETGEIYSGAFLGNGIKHHKTMLIIVELLPAEHWV